MELMLQREFLKLMKMIDGELCAMIILMTLQPLQSVGSYDLVRQFYIIGILQFLMQQHTIFTHLIRYYVVRLVKDFHIVFHITEVDRIVMIHF